MIKISTEASQTVSTGNRIYIMAKNTLIGRAQSLTADVSFGTEGVYELGSIMPQEHVYLKYTGTVTLERFRMIDLNFANASLGIAALGEDILQKDVIDINVMDDITKGVIETYRGCTADSHNTSMRANQIVTENMRFFFLTCSTQGA